VQDAAGRMIYAKEAAARLLGSNSPAELLAAPASELMARRYDGFRRTLHERLGQELKL
jgi:PAS domain-containing protein